MSTCFIKNANTFGYRVLKKNIKDAKIYYSERHAFKLNLILVEF